MQIVTAVSLSDIDAVRLLWRQYWSALDLPDDFQDFGVELLKLPGPYASPRGVLLLARVDGVAAGTVAMRPLGPEAAEAKRLYVRPAYRRAGVAAELMAKLVESARTIGYRKLYGDTLPSMSAAAALYERLGFHPTGPYSENPTPGAIYLELDLASNL